MTLSKSKSVATTSLLNYLNSKEVDCNIRGSRFIYDLTETNFATSHVHSDVVRAQVKKLIEVWGKHYYARPNSSAIYRLWIKNLTELPEEELE